MTDPKQIAAELSGLRTYSARGKTIPTLSRRQEALSRYGILNEVYTGEVRRRIYSIYEDKDVTDGMLQWVDHSILINPARDVVHGIACVYKRGASRSLKSESQSEHEKLEQLWSGLHAEAGTDRKAKDVNRYAYGIGPTAVIPYVTTTGKLRLSVLPPHRWLPIFDTADPEGPLEAVAIDLRSPSKLFFDRYELAGRQGESTKEAAIAIVDRETWSYWTADGNPANGPDGRHALEHGCKDREKDPRCPATVARIDNALDDDWWSSGRGRRLFTATIAGGVVLTRMLYVRQYQDGIHLAGIIPNQAEVEEGGILGHAAKPVTVTGAMAAHSRFDTIDLSTPIEEHLRTLNVLIATAALGEGFPPEAVAVTVPLDVGKLAGTRLPSVTLTDSIRSQYQHAQIDFFRPWETEDLAEAIAGVVHGAGHPAAKTLPPVKEVVERALIEYVELNTIDDPKARRDQQDWELSHGLKSRVDLIRERQPSLTREAALEQLKQNANEDAEVFDILAKRNQPRSPAAVINTPIGDSPSPAAANGALGPIVRDQPQPTSDPPTQGET